MIVIIAGLWQEDESQCLLPPRVLADEGLYDPKLYYLRITQYPPNQS